MTKAIRVLIADDNARSRNGLRALLGTVRQNPPIALKSGVDVETWPQVEVVGEAVDGREAVRQVGECRPDVVLMDVRMPVMDGLEASQYIKNYWPAVKVIALTMYGAYRAEALAAGVDAFLIKGSPVEELLEVILQPPNAD
jgi:DNA-binding NarL/FixJ family response regulator